MTVDLVTQETAASLTTTIRDLEVTDRETCELMGTHVAQAKDAKKALEEQRKLVAKPLTEAKKQLDGMFNPTIKALDELVKLGASKTGKFIKAEQDKAEKLRREQEAERQRKEREAFEEAQRVAAEAERLRKEAEESGDETAKVEAEIAEVARARAEQDLVAAQVKTSDPREEVTAKALTGSSASLRGTMKLKVVDAMLVPRQYLVVDEKALRAAGMEWKKDNKLEDLKIPGVEFWIDHSAS